MRRQPGDALPMGPPTLMWSINEPGILDPALMKAREEHMHYKTEDLIKVRARRLQAHSPR